MDPQGAYLLFSGRSLILWLGRAVHPSFLQQVPGPLPKRLLICPACCELQLHPLCRQALLQLRLRDHAVHPW